MAKQSKFYQVTNLVLLEYVTDQYRITSNLATVTDGDESANIYMYLGNDGRQYCLDMNNISDTKYPDESNSTYYFGGNAIDDVDLDGDETPDSSNPYGRDMYVNLDNKVGQVIKSDADDDGHYNELRQESILIRDTIKLYISTGYVMNNIAGYSVRVKARVNLVSGEDGDGNTIVKRIDDYVYLLDWFMPKENLKDKVQWLSNPLYLNSKFYDRYIEIEVPSALDIATNGRNIDYVYEYNNGEEVVYLRGNINKDSLVIIDFSTVSNDSITYVKETSSMYECSFILDAPKQIAISHSSNANNFNVCLLEDKDSRTVIYYPVYGDALHLQDFNWATMTKIETGTISMYDEADQDSLNDGMDDFIEMYGDSVYRWVIINELTVTYRYLKIILDNIQDQTDNNYDYTEYYTSTIDYSNKQNNTDEFYKSRFTPYVKPKNNMNCISIIISYTAHLFNRMNNIDIIRTGSMSIDPADYNSVSINTNNIILYKIINRIEQVDKSVQTVSQSSSTSQLVRSYYDVTNLLAKDTNTGTMYENGKMTLHLTHTNNNYLIKLYIVNDDNVRVPYDMTGTTDYKLVFPNVSGSKILIFPNKDSENYNLGIGSLIFYITGDNATAIMNVPESERYFALMTHIPDNSQEETTLYEGYVEWYI